MSRAISCGVDDIYFYHFSQQSDLMLLNEALGIGELDFEQDESERDFNYTLRVYSKELPQLEALLDSSGPIVDRPLFKEMLRKIVAYMKSNDRDVFVLESD